MIELIIEDSMVDMVVQWTDLTTRAIDFSYDLVGLALQVRHLDKTRMSLNPIWMSAKCNSDTMCELKEFIRKIEKYHG